MCRVLGVSPSGFYAWRDRPPSQRRVADIRLTREIREVFREGRGVCGSPRVFKELRARGHRLGRKRVERLMRAEGLQATLPKRFRRTTGFAHDLPVADNQLDRRFDVSERDQVWATDITYVRTHEGWLYLAVVMDLWSRRIIGWSMAPHMRTELVDGALSMALGNRRPKKGVLHHSDRGSQYASDAYQRKLRSAGMQCSMSRRGECYDNAVVESFFGTLKRELVYRHSWPTRMSARRAIHEYIEVFYNRRRRHSYLGYVSPAEFEKQSLAAEAA